LSKMSPQVLQSWSDAALDVMNKWPSGKPYLALYDLSHSGIVLAYLSLVKRRMCSLGITEAGEEQSLANIAQREGFSARVALYISRTYSGHLGGFSAEIDARRAGLKVVQYDAFYNREAAFDWLTKTQT
ncbi:MAG: hypothetical protein GY832_37635, partial [Chloroflexi bacterium]|nr:hypothetical protein [Chloroflexota bacterium]